MSLIDYKSLCGANKPNNYVSGEANKVANALINELYVQNGFGLAPFLGLPDSLENHKAIRVWVQGKLDLGQYCIDETSHNDIVCELSNELKNLCAFECSFNY